MLIATRSQALLFQLSGPSVWSSVGRNVINRTATLGPLSAETPRRGPRRLEKARSQKVRRLSELPTFHLLEAHLFALLLVAIFQLPAKSESVTQVICSALNRSIHFRTESRFALPS
jgi:hypothetical protein